MTKHQGEVTPKEEDENKKLLLMAEKYKEWQKSMCFGDLFTWMRHFTMMDINKKSDGGIDAQCMKESKGKHFGSCSSGSSFKKNAGSSLQDESATVPLIKEDVESEESVKKSDVSDSSGSIKRQGLPELGKNLPPVKLQKFESAGEMVQDGQELSVSAREKEKEFQDVRMEHSEMEEDTSCSQKTDLGSMSELQQDEESHVVIETTPSEDVVERDSSEMVGPDSSNKTEGCIYTFSEKPILLTTAKKEFSKGNNFLKGCKWSPDGTCILTNSEDGTLRLFNLPAELYNPSTWKPVPDIKSVLDMVEGELVYDYSWYPGMTSLQPETCCFVSTCRGHPVHMWDAFDGRLRCSYRPHDHMDELITPHSLEFSLDGSKLYCGFNKLIKTFDVTRPGKDCQTRQTQGKLGGQTGIVSCFAMNPDDKMFAAGSYSKTIGLYSESCPSAICILYGQASGITQLMYSPDGSKLFSGGRKDNQILCWDMRKLNEVLFCMNRNVTTNQRMYFDIDRFSVNKSAVYHLSLQSEHILPFYNKDRECKYLISGNQNGSVSVWALSAELSSSSDHPYPLLDSLTQFSAHEDTTNGVSLHPSLPLLATASGQRKIQPPDTGSDEESDEKMSLQDKQEGIFHNSLRIWSLHESK